MNLLTAPSVAELSVPAKSAQAWHAYRQGPTAAIPEDEFLKAHLPLVRRIVERIKATLPAHIEAEELYSVGIVGLVAAARSFRPDQGASFTTYAATRIRGTILDELRRMDWMPRRSRTKARELRRVVGELEQRLGRPASESEIAAAMDLSAEEYLDLLDEVRPVTCVELDAPCEEDDEEGGLHEVIADEAQETAHAHMEKKEMLELLAARIQYLPDVPRKVLALYYFEEMRLAEIAQIFGVTESRICQIHGQAILSLRAYLRSAMAR